MARIKSAIKNIRKSRHRRTINRARRSALRTHLKRLRALVAGKDAEGARGELTRTLSVIDRARSKGIIHRNTAARYKSRLSRQVAALGKSR